MTTSSHPSKAQSTSSTARWLASAGASLLLCGCCFWSGLLGWLFAPFSLYWANLVFPRPGKAELIAPAQWAPGGGRLSPDGRYMVLFWEKDGAARELFIWDLATDTRIPLRINMSTMCWLDATQFAVFDGTVLDPHYVVVRARDGKVLSASLSEYSAKDLNQVETLLRTQWQSRQQTFVLSNFFFSGYTIVVIKDDQPSVVYLDLGGGIENEQRIASLLANIPHTRIPDLCYYPGIDAEGSPIPLPSPDGRLVARENNALTEISITDQSGRLVAAIRRDGWNPNLLGWAHDSSGVYVQFFSRGSAAALTMSWKPIFKLAPLSPQEELLSWLAWLGGGAALVGGAWWLRRWWDRRHDSGVR